MSGSTSTRPPLEGARLEAPLVNQELVRVDGILTTVETVTATVGNLVNVVSATISSPLVKLSAFAYGLQRSRVRGVVAAV